MQVDADTMSEYLLQDEENISAPVGDIATFGSENKPKVIYQEGIDKLLKSIETEKVDGTPDTEDGKAGTDSGMDDIFKDIA